MAEKRIYAENSINKNPFFFNFKIKNMGGMRMRLFWNCTFDQLVHSFGQSLKIQIQIYENAKCQIAVSSI